LAIAGLIYLLVTMTASMVVPTGALSDSSGPLLEVVERGSLDIPLKLFAFIALLAVANGALINMIMASRLVYGMARRDIIPSVFSSVLSGRRTPHIAIALTTLIAAVLISTGDISDLADTTVLLLLGVFAIVNITVLVLRRDEVEGPHFRAPSILPVLGAVVSLVLIYDKLADDAEVGLRAGLLLALGVVLWLVNRVVLGRGEAKRA